MRRTGTLLRFASTREGRQFERIGRNFIAYLLYEYDMSEAFIGSSCDSYVLYVTV